VTVDGVNWNAIGAVGSALAGLAFLVAVFQFVWDSRGKREELRRLERGREEQAFEAVTTHYLNFLSLCLQYPHLSLARLDVGADADPENALAGADTVLFGDAARQDTVLFETFFQLLEKSFILYRAEDLYCACGAPKDPDRMDSANSASHQGFRERQWLGWASWIELYSTEQIFREKWKELDNDTTYDDRFAEFVHFCMEKAAPGWKADHGMTTATCSVQGLPHEPATSAPATAGDGAASGTGSG
jgi:hypothetical protein